MDILPVLTSILVTTPARWTALAEHIPAELLTARPAPQEWSATECLLHLIDTEQIFCQRVEAFLAGQDFPAFDPDSQGSRQEQRTSTRDLAAHFAALRQRSLELLGRVAAGDLERQVRHAELGPVRLRELLNEWGAHDLAHTRQAERALMQPLIAGCGPWQIYFTDHVIEA